MSAHSAPPPLSVRRSEAQGRIAVQRIAIGAAWAEFAPAEAHGEATLVRAITWMRRAFAVTAAVAVVVGIRHLARQRGASAVVGALALARAARRLLVVVRRSPER